VVTVAVVTSGDIRGDIGFAQRHGLAVISVAIMFEAILVTFAAALVAHHLEVPVLGRFDFVRAVAIRADRAAFVACREQLPVHALLVDLFNADVTLAAGLGDVRVVDGGVAIHGTLDVVDTVAIIAGRRHNEAHFQQRAPVNAVVVMSGGLGILHLVFLGEPGVAVTLGAGLGQIEFEHGRFGLFHRTDIVAAVAIPAIRRPGRAQGVAHAVDAGGILLGRVFVTTRAVRRRQLALMHQILDAFVTINAIELRVQGFIERVGGEQQRHGLISDGAGGGGIEMAIQAVRVGDFFRRKRTEWSCQKTPRQKDQNLSCPP